MPCCAPALFPFSGAFVTSINYDSPLQEAYGAAPKIQLYYLDNDAGNYYELNGAPGVQVKFNGSVITVDHGGQATGYLRIS